MKTASKLLVAAFALAAIGSVALPTAQPAAAASGPDLKVSIETWDGGSGGLVLVGVGVKNVGDAKSQTGTLTRFCGYLNDSNKVSWIAQEAPSILQPTDPGKMANVPQSFFCKPVNGNHPVAARAYVISGGDTNPANNDLKLQSFSL